MAIYASNLPEHPLVGDTSTELEDQLAVICRLKKL
jgi:hypothetical protein